MWKTRNNSGKKVYQIVSLFRKMITDWRVWRFFRLLFHLCFKQLKNLKAKNEILEVVITNQMNQISKEL